MRVEVDQSGKVEYTSKPTVVAFSNKESGSIILSAGDKRHLQQVFRNAEKPRMFVIQTFACLLYLLLKDYLAEIDHLVIDREYPGYEDLIKSYLIQLMMRDLKISPLYNIYFDEIGRKSPAHLKAYQGYQEGVVDKKVVAEDILGLVLKLK